MRYTVVVVASLLRIYTRDIRTLTVTMPRATFADLCPGNTA